MSEPTSTAQTSDTPGPGALFWIRRWLIALAVVVLVPYVVFMGVLYFTQRSMQYFPTAQAETPSIEGLAIEDVRIRTPDGETLQAWYEPAPAGKPVVLFFYGNAGTLMDGRWRYQRMHGEGVGWLAINYRGYGISTGHPTEHGLFIDGLAAYDWLRAKGVAADRIVIHGFSLGSGVATYVATQRPAHALILEAPFTAAVDVAAAHYWFMPVGWLMADQYLSRERIKDVHMPVLIAHGDRDSIIPYAQGVALYGLANAPKTFVHMVGSDHSTMTRDGVYACYWKFLSLAYDHGDAARVCGSL